MKHKCFVLCVALMLVSVLSGSVTAAAAGSQSSTEEYLYIKTTDSRPLAVDRLVYFACKNADYNAVLTSASMQSGCISANAGEADGVISSLPNMEDYPNLIKVPVVLEQTNIYVLARPDSNINISNWSELDGLSIGILTERVYILERLPEGAAITTKETASLVLEGLAQGEYDVAVLSVKSHETLGSLTDVVYAGQIDSLDEYLYLNKSNAHLVPLLANTLNKMFADGRADDILYDIPIPEINQKQTILHIISSKSDETRESLFTASLRKQFEDDMSIEWYTISLNTSRFLKASNRLVYFANLLRQDCVSRNITAIVVSGDDALEFLTDYYYLYFRNVPVLFYGVYEQYETIIEGYEENFTGIVENLEAYETVQAALKLFPDTNNIYVVNDYLTEGSHYRGIIEEQLKLLEDSINIEYSENISCESMLAHIKELPKDSLVLVGAYFLDSEGQYYHQNEMKRLLEKNCSVPVFSLHSATVEYNSVGGKSMDYEKYGEVIAGMLKDILGGTDVSSIPVITDSTGYNRWAFDKNLLDAFGIRESALPEGSQVVNKALTLWESNPRFAATLVILLIVGITVVICVSALLVEHRKRKEQRISDAKIREVKERLEWIIRTSSVGYMLVISGKVAEINENMKASIGLNDGDSIRRAMGLEGLSGIGARLKRQEELKNELIETKFANGEKHRCLVSIASFKHEGQSASVVWMVDVEQTEAQKDQLHAARQSLQTILDSLPVSIRITDSETAAIVYVNKACLEMFGFDTVEDIYKVSVNDLVPDVQSDGTDSHEKINLLLNSDAPITIDVEYITTKGNIIDTRVTGCRIDYNGRKSTLGIITDLAKEKESQRIRKNLQTVLDMMPVAVRIIDNNTKLISYVNRAAADMFGVASPDDAVGFSSLDFIPETQQDGTESSDLLKKVKLTSKPVMTEITLRKANGGLFDSLVTSSLIDYNGTESSLGILQDLTAEKKYQMMLANTAEKEREANLLKSRFLVNMSHEIRTPMNVIIGLTEIELHKEQPGEPKEIYKKINTSAKNLLAIINDILDLSKIEADKVELVEDEFELEEVLNSALLVATPRLDGKNVEFMLNEALDLPRYILGDKTRLWQILKNFLDNSAKFTEHGKIVLTVFTDNEKSDDDTVTIKFIIEDTGIGMDENQMKRVFLPYEQVYNDAQKKYSGTGLGMTISKQLCELMGGKLQVQSRAGIGTIVHVSIPFRRSVNSETELHSVNPQALAGTNILVVDDDSLALEIMKRLIESGSAKCTTARSGTEAMDIILKSHDRGEFFDAILLDYMMNGLDGLETAKQIQLALSEAPKLLMVTAYQKLLIKDELEANGILDVIEKPFIPSHFINKICVALGLKSNDDESLSKVFSKFKNARVLVCEDYHLNQEVAAGMLAQFGVDSTIVEDGKQGIEILNSGEMFDLIFMDLQMPVMDGYEATRIIRDDPKFDRIPIICLTADAMKEIVDECLAIGMNDHLAKPIEFRSLNKILQKWLPESTRINDGEILKPAAGPHNEALERFGNSNELYNKALLEFSQILPDEWQDFESAMESREEMKRYIHKLKGAAGNLAEKEIYQFAVEFESSLRGGSPDKALYERLVYTCHIVKRRIIGQLKDEEVIPAERGTSTEFAELMSALKEALQEYDPNASSAVIRSLKEKSWPTADETALKKLYGLTQKYEFEAALDILILIMGGSNE